MSDRFLPPEIWAQVIKLFCYHCNRGVSEPGVPDHRLDSKKWRYQSPLLPAVSVAALASLSRVSKTLNYLTTPILYHLPITSKPGLLLRTLTSHPELARHVRELHHNLWTDWPWNDRNAYPAAFLELCGHNCDYILERPRDVMEPGGWTPIELLDSDKGAIEERVRDTTIIGLLPNLNSISIESQFRDVCAGLIPGSLPKLTSACVSHGDMNLYLELRQLRHLTTAAPNLTSLHLDGVGSEETDPSSFPVFPNVTDLTLETSAILAESWPSLLGAFPRLETLTYRGGDPTDEYPQGSYAHDIQQALVEYCPELKRLCVEFTMIEFYDDSEETERAFDRGLASLRKLEYLMTDASCIGIPESEDAEEKGDVAGICIDALPASLRGLRILGWRDNDVNKLPDALLTLAKAVPERFPNLKSVEIMSDGGYFLDKDLKSAWEMAGVELTVSSTNTHGYWYGAEWLWPWPS